MCKCKEGTFDTPKNMRDVGRWDIVESKSFGAKF
jgi:hypothetical protein